MSGRGSEGGERGVHAAAAAAWESKGLSPALTCASPPPPPLSPHRSRSLAALRALSKNWVPLLLNTFLATPAVQRAAVEEATAAYACACDPATVAVFFRAAVTKLIKASGGRGRGREGKGGRGDGARRSSSSRSSQLGAARACPHPRHQTLPRLTLPPLPLF